jgi:demethylmenaquinone methyltransferase / 2-methoxy-6-polyprenyl-1,4-benzoquinol methylase
MDPERTQHARRLFAGIAPEYDRMGSVLSFGQDPRWRRFLVSKVNAIPGSWVLDVATGTGLVARELAHRNVRVIGLDQSPAMTARGRDALRELGLDHRVRSVLGQAQALPFADASFDAVTFTYLLRYVDDPAATVAELVRVLRPGGVMASLEGHVPPESWARAGWFAHTRVVMPAVGWVVSPAWYRTGQFLGRSISEFVRRYPLPVQVRWWQEAGMRRVRTKLLSNGAAVVTWAVKATPVLDAQEPETEVGPMALTEPEAG